MRVFVTGVSGFVGSELSAVLAERGHVVLGLVRSDDGAARLRAVGGEPVRGDMREPAGWKAEAATADGIVHAAAIGFRRRGGARWLRTLEQADAVALRTLIDAAEAGGRCRALIYTSAFLAVGDHGEEWVDEDTPATPGARGRACVAGERLAAGAARRGVPAFSLRLGWVYAASGFFARLVLPRAAKGKFTYMGNGLNFMPTVSRADAVEAYVRALEEPRAGVVLNVVDDEPLRMREIGELLLREFGDGRPRGMPVGLARIVAGGPIAEAFSGSYRTRNAKAKDLLAWKPRYLSFREGVKDVIAQYRASA